MGLFSRILGIKSRVTTLQLGFVLATYVEAAVGNLRKSASELQIKPKTHELTYVCIFSVARGAGHHRLATTLREVQNRLLFDSFYNLNHALAFEGFGALEERFKPGIEWRNYEQYLHTIDQQRHTELINVIKERMGEYDPLVDAFLAASSEDRSKVALRLGDRVADNVFGANEGKKNPMVSFWASTAVFEPIKGIGKLLDGVTIRPDPEAERHTLVLPEEILEDIVLTCPHCRQKNRVRSSARGQAFCGRCHKPI